jgi:hypothetical protein
MKRRTTVEEPKCRCGHEAKKHHHIFKNENSCRVKGCNCKFLRYDQLPPLEERISYVVNGLYGPETDENGRFICASEKLKEKK